MSRGLILGKLDRDLACAVALGLVESPHVAANQRARAARERGRALLAERGTLDVARAAGLPVIDLG